MEKSSRESNHREPLAVGKRYVRAVKEHFGALNRTRKAVGLSVAARYSRGVFFWSIREERMLKCGWYRGSLSFVPKVLWHFQGRYFFILVKIPKGASI